MPSGQGRYSPASVREDCNGGTELLQKGHVHSHNESTETDASTETQRNCEKRQQADKVHYSIFKKPCSGRRWTSFEKYLCSVCVLLLLACVAFIVIAFTRDQPQQCSPGNSNVCKTANCIKTAAQLMDSMDMAADPCEDFFQYACGTWNKKYVIPEDKATFNTFEKLHDDLQVILKDLLEEPSRRDEPNAIHQAKVLYRSCMNTTQIQEIGDGPFRKVLEDLGSWPIVAPRWDGRSFVLEDTLAKLRSKYNTQVLVKTVVGPDDKNSSVNIIQLDQPELGMPSREYYHDPESKVVKSYLRFIVKVALVLGADPDQAETDARDVVCFETELANVTKPRADRHDTGAMYQKMTIGDLEALIPGFDWLRYLQGVIPIHIARDEEIVLFAPEYLSLMVNLVKKTETRVVVNYIIWRIVMDFTEKLTTEYSQLRNEYRKILQGVSRDKVKWQQCVEYVNEKMGMAVGAMFIKDHFKKESKDTALEMIHNLREAFDELLLDNDWMDDETRAVAREKAYAMNERIGYPEFILDRDELDELYEQLDLDERYFLENVLTVEEFDAQFMLKKLRQQIRKDKWLQDPAVVNAFYNPNTNDIVFPAGILQPLFYSRHFPQSLNYGGIGVVIGHEITHGFDDKGRQYDQDGNLKQWWKNETIAAFQERAQCMIDQYSSYVLDQIDMNIDGKNTQGENIADNGGLKQSYKAYRKWVERNGEEPLLPGIGLNHNQLFFLNYAQIWCGTMRDEEALQKIRIAVHSPGPIRVLGPLSNSKDFSEAYGCPLGSRMNPKHKCSVW
ncbi:neprilysin-1-like [Liolophura sinensis]|uniref:neprilysin-1-like n=1 Tax=Liolophura sinensis TaxID=3198878 RepID=UPI003157FB0F